MIRRRMTGGPDEVERLRRERDLYRAILELGATDDLPTFLREALTLVVATSDAEQGYLELYGDGGSGARAAAATLRVAHGFPDEAIDGIRRSLSTGIVAEALASGETIATASAVDDPRFSAFSSVQAGRIRAVLCAPVAVRRGSDLGPTLGAIYLQGRRRPGPFDADDRARLELVARHLAPLADRLLAREDQRAHHDHTTEPRARLPGGAAAIAGRSRAVADTLRQVLVAAPVPVTVLIRGESGTGKTAIARLLHAASPRAAGPFVEVNAGAIPEALVESELFGAEKGAHSTATARVIGKVEAAAGGTLFLDEIADLPLASQAKLLTFLQSRTFHRLGGTTPVQADVRVLAATHQDLEVLVAGRRFREDLYYRLAVLEVTVPPLRERREDVAIVADAIAARMGDDPAARRPLSHAARVALAESEWPGNVRQLENVIARGWARALAAGAAAIAPEHLFEGRAPRAPAERAPGADDEKVIPYHEALRRHQGRVLEAALEACGWNVTEAARRLELSRSHLNDLIRAHGLTRRAAGRS